MVRQTQSKVAFTLVELLVVIAIIVALLALLMPAMTKAREAANRALCGSRQHQLFIAFYCYAADHKGDLPYILPIDGGVHMLWCWNKPVADALRQRYTGNSWEVMTDVTDRFTENDWLFPAEAFRVAGFITTSHPYVNAGVRTDVFDTYGVDYAVQKLTAPSTRMLLADPLYHTPPYDNGNVWAWRWNLPHYGYHAGRAGAVDGYNASGGNQTSLDGSTRWRDFGEMKLRLFQIRFGESRTYWW